MCIVLLTNDSAKGTIKVRISKVVEEDNTMATNVVLAGDMEGGEVALSVGGKSAYVINGQRTRYINKNEVTEIVEVNRSVNNGVLTRGSAITSISKDVIMLEIHWKTGTTSLVKVDNMVHQAMIVGMYNNITESQQTAVERKDSSSRQISTIIGLVIFVIGIFTYVIPVVTG